MCLRMKNAAFWLCLEADILQGFHSSGGSFDVRPWPRRPCLVGGGRGESKGRERDDWLGWSTVLGPFSLPAKTNRCGLRSEWWGMVSSAGSARAEENRPLEENLIIVLTAAPRPKVAFVCFRRLLLLPNTTVSIFHGPEKRKDNTRGHAGVHTHTHTHAHACTHTHTPTNTHTHTHALRQERRDTHQKFPGGP